RRGRRCGRGACRHRRRGQNRRGGGNREQRRRQEAVWLQLSIERVRYNPQRADIRFLSERASCDLPLPRSSQRFPPVAKLVEPLPNVAGDHDGGLAQIGGAAHSREKHRGAELELEVTDPPLDRFLPAKSGLEKDRKSVV